MIDLPSIDAHAHIDPTIDRQSIDNLGSFVMAVTRTLKESDAATLRSDPFAVWGVGCHPGLMSAQKSFDVQLFEHLIGRTVLVGEIGLDGGSRVPMELQAQTLNQAFGVLHRVPRLTTLHSYGAVDEMLELLTPRAPKGTILHWWLGDALQTRKAIEMGCYFSVNASSTGRKKLLDLIPLERTLTETDHPFGDRRSRLRRPGMVEDVEKSLGRIHGLRPNVVRHRMWCNLHDLVSVTGCLPMLPVQARELLASL